MRVNVYAEELTDRVEIITKTIDGQDFTGLRIYLELPVTMGGRAGRHRSAEGPEVFAPISGEPAQVTGPFMHRPGDDDSSAVTFWGKRDLREVLKKALAMLDEHYAQKSRPLATGEWRREHDDLWVHTNGAMVRRSAIDGEFMCFGPGTNHIREPVPAFTRASSLEDALTLAKEGPVK